MKTRGLLVLAMTLPVLGQLIFPLAQSTKSDVRRFERCAFKIVRRKCSTVFNQICLREGLLPKYTNIKLHDEAAKDEPFTLEFRRCLLRREIDHANTIISDAEKEAMGDVEQVDRKVEEIGASIQTKRRT